MRLLILTQAVDLDDPILGFFHRWIEEFSKHVSSVRVICLREGRHALPPNVTVHSLGKEFGASRLARVLRFYRLIWLFRSEYDSVFVHMNPEYVVLGGLMWRALGKRIALWYAHKSVTLWLRIAEKLVHRIFSPSAQSFRLRTQKLLIVGHGIPLDIFLPHMHSSLVMLCTIGRLSPAKRIQEMIAIERELRRRGRRVSLVIAGAPATKSDIAYEEAVRADAIDGVTLAGPIAYRDVPTFLQDKTLFLNLSATGSMDKAVLESFAAGVPVLSSNEAFREVLEPEHLFVSDMRAESLVDAVEGFLVRTDRESLGHRLRTYVAEHHSLDSLIPTIVEAL